MDERLNEAQQEVNRLMGRCVLRLQQCERLLKSILKQHDISGELQDVDAVRVARFSGMSRQTLGTLVKALVGSVLVSGEPAAIEQDGDDSDEDAPHFRMIARLGLAKEDYARTEAELREFVHQRNELIHHFMERHDLWTMEGCRAAQQDLVASCDRIGVHFERLRMWATELECGLHEFSQVARTEAFHEAVVNGILPGGTVFWPGAFIVSALRQAAQVLAVDGWTEVSAAARWVAERYPDQTPEKYGCTTFPQVLHDSGEFDLRRLEKDGLPRRHYRLRDNAKQKDGGQIAHFTVSLGMDGKGTQKRTPSD